jgi:hypothetical protein
MAMGIAVNTRYAMIIPQITPGSPMMLARRILASKALGAIKAAVKT